MNPETSRPQLWTRLNARIQELTVELAAARAALESREVRLAGLVNSAMDAIISVDAEHNVELFNPAAEKMFGCPASRALGQSLDRFIHQGLQSRHPEADENFNQVDVTARSATALGELTGVRGDGTEFPVEASISSFQSSGRTSSTAILRDVTERRQVEEDLRRTSENMVHLLSHSPAVIYRLKADGDKFVPTFVSGNIMPWLGFTAEEATRANWWLESLHPEECDAVRTTVTRERNLAGYSLEYRLRHKDGTYRWVKDDNRVLRDATGAIKDVLGAWTDISPQKEAEALLIARIAAHERLAKVAATLPGVIYTFRLRPDGSNCFPYASPQVAEYFGVEAAVIAVDGTSVFAAMHPDDVGRVWAGIAASARTLAPWRDEFRLRHPQKGECWIAANSIAQREADGGTLWHGFTMDVTERRRSEEALHVSENRFRSLFENMIDGYAYCRMLHANGIPDDFVYLEVNSAFERLTGLKGVTGRKVSEVIPGIRQTNPELLKCYGRVASTGRPERFEVKMIGIWLAVAVYSPAKECFVAVFEDITKRKEAEVALESERTLLRTLFNLLPVDIYIKDTESRFIAGNSAVARRMGVASTAELVGKSDADFLAASEAAMLRAEELAVLGGAAMVDKENSTPGPDGKTHYSITSKLPLKDAAGKIVGLVGTGRDVTERRRAEEELRLFRALVDQSTDSFEVIDPETGCFLDINECGCVELGYARGEFLGLTIFDVDPSMSRADWPAHVAGVRSVGATSGEGSHRRKDGTTFPVEFNVRWVHLDRDYLVSIVRDISGRKQLEEQFMRMQRLETIGTLASGIAHDLNNILAPMLMAAGLLKGKLTDQRDLDILSMVERSAQRGASIIGQLLTFSRGVEGARVSVQTKHLLREMINIMRETFPRNIEIEQNLPGELWTVVADATQLHQVLMNLCVNARDAMPEGGTLSLEAKDCLCSEGEAKKLGLAKGGPYLQLSVRDTGHGIPAAILGRIFDPFFTTKENGKGTGLGLSTVLGIAKSHGGVVTVESQVGVGTVFNVYLPATGETLDAPREESMAPMPMGQGELVLVVDDEPAILETTSQVLRAHGYRVITAKNGEEAIRLFVQNAGAVHLILTDVMMPGIGAQELVSSLRVLEPKIKIIACTGLGEDDKRGELAAMGVTQMLTKPCPSALLVKAVFEAFAVTK